MPFSIDFLNKVRTPKLPFYIIFIKCNFLVDNLRGGGIIIKIKQQSVVFAIMSKER